MVQITPNFDEVEDISPVPEGTYTARLVDITESEKQHNTLRVMWEIYGEQQAGRKLFDNIAYAGPFAWKLQALHKALTGEAFPVGQPLDTTIYNGRAARLTVIHKKSEDGATTYVNVKAMSPIG